MAILNSKLTTYIYNVIYGSTKIGGAYIYLKGSQIETFYIPKTTPKQQKPLVELSEKMLSLNKDLQKKTNRFISRIKETYNLKKITQNIESFYNLSFADFVKELAKQKIKISMKQ
ncbi:hypothetical protein LS73_004355 [Helicobacter muridarum]|uniref:Uncharacterized protein n=1 Tax=Helicobacter muridarum TaxID=216 RepID=A0A099U024_9HELI|nr:hypothetical protein [Helicobacter muridarum]TLE00646.1 hypothetical protein LS73_004355 [Helicobacter muridarum]STQ85665.1 Uncharacterised protein [Helicobacter muridarum]